MDQHRSALREPMVWLMLALPLAAVLAGTATLVLALEHGADTVYGSSSHVGPVPADELQPQRAAAALGLAASLAIDGAGQVTLRLAPVDMPLPRMQLTFVHPTERRRDRSVELTRDSDGAYHGRVVDTARAGSIVLEPPDRSWRLSGRLDPGAATTLLGAGI